MFWSPKLPDDYKVVSKLTKVEFSPTTPTDKATWNLSWLFDYTAHAALDGTVEGITAQATLQQPKVVAALREDIKDDTYGMRTLAETCGPVEFMDKMLRRPFKQTMLYAFAGPVVWQQARVSAEKLAAGLEGRAKQAQVQAGKAIASAKVFEFPKRA